MKKQFTFVEKKNLWLTLSILIILIGFSLMGMRHYNSKPILNYGIDFVGGNTFYLRLLNTPSPETSSTLIKQTRDTLSELNLKKSQVQLSEKNEIYIKTAAVEKNITSEIVSNLKKPLGEFEILEIDFIGPSIGKSLRKQSLLIILFVTLSLLTYITFRFQLNFGLAAIAALLHDGLMILSFSSLFNIEINTAFIAALLTILGYSINDTIVIFDKIREQKEKLRDHIPFAQITNNSLNQTLPRTINTSITTLLVILSLIFFGGETIQEFCIILFIGILSGTYSSLCIASPLIVYLEEKFPPA